MSNTNKKEDKSSKTESFKNITTIIANFATIVGVIIIYIAIYEYNISVKSLQHASINSCMTRFTELRPELINIKTFNKDSISDEQSIIVHKYLDLCEEELFYIQHNIVPEEIALDWVSGMIRKLREMNFNIDDYSTYHRIEGGWHTIQNEGSIKNQEEQTESRTFIKSTKKLLEFKIQ